MDWSLKRKNCLFDVELRVIEERIADCDANTSATETELSSDPEAIGLSTKKNESAPMKREKIFVNHISNDEALTKEKNENFQSHHIIGLIKPLESDNHFVSEEAHTSNDISEPPIYETTRLDSSVNVTGYNFNETDMGERSCSTKPAYEDPWDKMIKRKSSLAESDDSSNDDNDPHKRRIKCLHYIGLFICGILLTIVVVYYGSEPAEADRKNFTEISNVSREQNLIPFNRIIDETITEVLLKIPNPPGNVELVTEKSLGFSVTNRPV